MSSSCTAITLASRRLSPSPPYVRIERNGEGVHNFEELRLDSLFIDFFLSSAFPPSAHQSSSIPHPNGCFLAHAHAFFPRTPADRIEGFCIAAASGPPRHRMVHAESTNTASGKLNGARQTPPGGRRAKRVGGGKGCSGPSSTHPYQVGLQGRRVGGSEEGGPHLSGYGKGRREGAVWASPGNE